MIPKTARKRVAAGFAMWRDAIERGLERMRERGTLSPSTNPQELAMALLTAVQGGLLLSKTMKSNRPLEIALDAMRRSSGLANTQCSVYAVPGKLVNKKQLGRKLLPA
jgi:hypothetical protein